jgi:prevent-host-death family protein
MLEDPLVSAVDECGQLWLYLAMTRVRIVELKNRLSHHLRSVEAGAEVEVTDRDRPIARIVPVSRGTGVTVRPPARSFKSIRDRTYPPADWEVHSTELLAQERQAR